MSRHFNICADQGGAGRFLLDLPHRSRWSGDEIIVDNFAGGGGASTGIEIALGRSPDIAINHDPEAVAMHSVNHPQTQHYCQNIWQADPVEVCAGRPVGLAWFSPDCKHFSKAKGGKPVEKNIRDLAWVVVLWAQKVRPRVIILENVEEFQTWCPLGPDNQPDFTKKGETFKAWVAELKRLKYKVEWKELRASEYGTPTIRKRLFVIARCDGLPIVWPEPTHGPDKLPFKTAASDVIDWSIPCPSIFERDRPLAEATMRRIAAGLRRFVLESASPFIVTCNHSGEGFRGQGVDEPFKTITSAHDAHGLVDAKLEPVEPFIVRIDHQSSARADDSLDEPVTTITSKARHALITPYIAGCGGRAGQSAPRSTDEPMATMTAKADQILVTPFLAPRYGERDGQAPRAQTTEAPLPTVVPTENSSRLVAVHLSTMRNAQKPFNGADEPTHTVTAGGAGLSMVSAFLAKYRGDSAGSAATEPMPTVTANSFIKKPGGAAPHAVVAAHLSRFHTKSTGGEAEQPLTTIETKDTHALVTAFMAQHNGGDREMIGKEADQPLTTVTASGSQQAIITSHMVKLRGTEDSHIESAAISVEEPVPTISAGGNHVGEVRAFLVKYYGTGAIGQPVDEPVHTVTAKHRLGLVTVQGVDYQIVDIGMRMLTPRELFRAQGFPPDYVIDFEIKGRPLPKYAQVRCCGNSVCPPLAAALVKANYQPRVMAQEAAE